MYKKWTTQLIQGFCRHSLLYLQ